MRVAVMSLCRDRLPYTKHCFERLRTLAGCVYEHYVLDNGSQDGTVEWLEEQFEEGFLDALILQPENIGCTRGWNELLEIVEPERYDVIVCFDNDCEMIQTDTLAVVAGLTADHEVILSPRVLGLMYPPSPVGHFTLGEYSIQETAILGNIFMAIPSKVFKDFRWDERYQVWDGGESVTQWYRDRGGRCGYVEGFEVNHYLTTLGQKEDMPWYAERRVAEGGRSM